MVAKEIKNRNDNYKTKLTTHNIKTKEISN